MTQPVTAAAGPRALAVAALVVALVVPALLGGCATSSEAADAARRRELVLVPADAQPAEELRWSRVRSIQPLNRRMILFNAERPYLLVLADSCSGLRSDSIVVTENQGSVFRPRVDSLWIVDPFSDLALAGGLANPAFIGGRFTRNDLLRGATLCRPDTLYALRDEDVDWLRQSLASD